MTTMTDFPDGTKFKDREQESTSYLPSSTRAVVRFDGKNFSSFTKQFETPYDDRFMGLMDEVTRRFIAEVPNAHFGYTQSDEISIVFSDFPRDTARTKDTELWFGGRIQKILSVGAATITALFMDAMGGVKPGAKFPVFDARVHTLDDVADVEEYVRWRRFDAQKNSVTMAAHALHSHKELQGVSSKGRLALLEGTEYEKLPDGFYNGRITYREAYEQTAFVPNRHPAGKKFEKGTVTRHRWVTVPATRTFMETDFTHLNR